MKRQIRNGCFETNSSSTHSICIPVAESYGPLPDEVIFRPKHYEWGPDIEYFPGDYLYSTLLSTGQTAYIDRLKEILERRGVKVRFMKPDEEPEFEDGDYVVYDYVDHAGCFDYPFSIDYLFCDEERLLRFLFAPDSCVYIYSSSNWDEYFNEIHMLEQSGRFEIYEKGN